MRRILAGGCENKRPWRKSKRQIPQGQGQDSIYREFSLADEIAVRTYPLYEAHQSLVYSNLRLTWGCVCVQVALWGFPKLAAYNRCMMTATMFQVRVWQVVMHSCAFCIV